MSPRPSRNASRSSMLVGEQRARRPLIFVTQIITFVMLAGLITTALPFLFIRFVENSLGYALTEIYLLAVLYWGSLLGMITLMFFGIFAVALHCAMTATSLLLRKEAPTPLTIINTALTLPAIYLILTAMDFLHSMQ